MKTRPILFSDDMVRAIQDGRKTQTRRLHKEGRVYADRGDVLWVREAWRLGVSLYHYRADASDSEKLAFKWRPSIFMPRKACRLELLVESVRTELLGTINDHDAASEGFATVEEFRQKWTAIHGDTGNASWGANPLVWVVTFSVL